MSFWNWVIVLQVQLYNCKEVSSGLQPSLASHSKSDRDLVLLQPLDSSLNLNWCKILVSTPCFSEFIGYERMKPPPPFRSKHWAFCPQNQIVSYNSRNINQIHIFAFNLTKIVCTCSSNHCPGFMTTIY